VQGARDVVALLLVIGARIRREGRRAWHRASSAYWNGAGAHTNENCCKRLHRVEHARGAVA